MALHQDQGDLKPGWGIAFAICGRVLYGPVVGLI